MGENSGTTGTSEIATRYPVTTGLTAETTKQEGRESHLIAEESHVSENDKVGVR